MSSGHHHVESPPVFTMKHYCWLYLSIQNRSIVSHCLGLGTKLSSGFHTFGFRTWLLAKNSIWIFTQPLLPAYNSYFLSLNFSLDCIVCSLAEGYAKLDPWNVILVFFSSHPTSNFPCQSTNKKNARFPTEPRTHSPLISPRFFFPLILEIFVYLLS